MRVARAGAIKARTAALNQLHGLITAAPEVVRADLTALPTAALLAACAAFSVDEARLSDPVQATKAALAALAHRVQALTGEITKADKRLRPIVARTAPRLSALSGIGPDVAGQLLATPGRGPAGRPRKPTYAPPSPIMAGRVRPAHSRDAEVAPFMLG